MIKSEYKRNLVDYFKKNLTKAYPAESLKWALLNQGYLRMDVLKALEQANKELASEAPILKEKPKIKFELLDEDYQPVSINRSLWKKIKNWFG